jgi:uncharacterized membrane protein
MKNQRTLFWGVLVSYWTLIVILGFISVGVGMAVGDCVKCTPMPPPHILYSADYVISLLGFPLVPLGGVIANITSINEGGRTFGGIVLYALNGWLLAYLASIGIAKIWRRA